MNVDDLIVTKRRNGQKAIQNPDWSSRVDFIKSLKMVFETPNFFGTFHFVVLTASFLLFEFWCLTASVIKFTYMIKGRYRQAM